MGFRSLVLALVATLVSADASTQRGASFNSDGVEIHYIDRGAGTAVILLHGLTGSSARHFERTGILDGLTTAGYRAIAMDARGHGESGKPHEENAYGVPMVADVVRLLDHLKIARAHLVGYSMGGVVANQLLVRHPSRLRTVTLIGAGWEGNDLTDLRRLLFSLADGFAAKDATPLIRRVSGDQLGNEELAAANAALFERNDSLALAQATRGLLALFEVPEPALRAVTLPVLAVVGEQDSNLVAAKRMAGVVGSMELIVIPGATHATSVSLPAPHIIAFLKTQERH